MLPAISEITRLTTPVNRRESMLFMLLKIPLCAMVLPIAPITSPVTAPMAEKIRRTINLLITMSFLVTGITIAYFSHLD